MENQNLVEYLNAAISDTIIEHEIFLSFFSFLVAALHFWKVFFMVQDNQLRRKLESL